MSASSQDELKVLFVWMLDAHNHSLPGFIDFVESRPLFKLDKLANRERFLRFLFSVRAVLSQFPDLCEFNIKAVDRWAKLAAQAGATNYPWNVEDFTKSTFINADFPQAAPGERPSAMIEKAVMNNTNDELMERLKLLRFAQHELKMTQRSLEAKLNAATSATASTAGAAPINSPVIAARATTRPRAMSNAGSSASNTRRSRSLGRAPTSTSTSSSKHK